MLQNPFSENYSHITITSKDTDYYKEINQVNEFNFETDKPDPENTLFKSFLGVKAISSSQVKIDDKLGEGAFGEVFKGTWKNNKEIALKKIDIMRAYDLLRVASTKEQLMDMIAWEINRLSTVSHPNIVLFYGLYQEMAEGYPYIVMEFCQGGTLGSMLKKEDVPWYKRWQWALEITQGLAYLHNKGVLHRDLKAENILIDANSCARLADLGLAQVDALLAQKEATLVSLGIQDQRFIAPENAPKINISNAASDIYALGLVYWQIASGKKGVDTPNPLRLDEISSQAERAPIPSNCPETFKQLILACCSFEHEQRPTAADVIQQLYSVAPDPNINVQNIQILTLCYKLSDLIQEKRQEMLDYMPPFLTDHQIATSFDEYWKNAEKAKKKGKKLKNPPLDLFERLNVFLDDAESDSLLLLGEPGSGKTLSMHIWADQLLSKWFNYFSAPQVNPHPTYFPIFVRPALSKWIYDALKNEGFNKICDYYGLPKDSKFGLLLIFDAYDEYQMSGANNSENLIQAMNVPKEYQVKLVTTCRPRTVPESEQQQQFGYKKKLKIYHFLGFSDEQLVQFLVGSLGWEANQKKIFLDAFEHAKELREILRNPFVLHLFIESFESLKNKDFECLTNWEIYDAVVSEWLRKTTGQDTADEKSLLHPQVKQHLEEGYCSLKDSFNTFASELAFKAFINKQLFYKKEEIKRLKRPLPWSTLENSVTLVAENTFKKHTKLLPDKEKPSRSLLGANSYISIMQERYQKFMADSPLKPRGDRYEFTHKSFLEYYAALYMLHQLSSLPDNELHVNFKRYWYECNRLDAPQVWDFVKNAMQPSMRIYYEEMRERYLKFLNYPEWRKTLFCRFFSSGSDFKEHATQISSYLEFRDLRAMARVNHASNNFFKVTVPISLTSSQQNPQENNEVINKIY